MDGHDLGFVALERMRVCFLIHEVGASGGAGVVYRHARRLASHGIDAELVLTRGEPREGDFGDVPLRTLEEAREEDWDVALATWWETAAALWQLRARSRAVFLQSLEDRFYREHEPYERLGAGSVLGLPVHFLTIGSWLRDVVAELRPGARCALVRNGIDKEVFRPPPERGARSGPLRVLVEGQPTLWFKAVPEAIAAARAVPEEVDVTLVAPQPAGAEGLGADRVVGGLDAPGMAALYADHDVLVKLSRVEGVALAPIEAMHVGLPSVLTPHTGHEEYLVHGENGLLVGFDDPASATGAISALARDRALLERLSQGAVRTAAEWPSGDESTAALADALRDLAAAPPPALEDAMALTAARRQLVADLGRGELNRLRAVEQLEAHERAQNDELVERIRATERRLADAEAEFDTRAFRVALRGRQALHRIARRGGGG